MKRFLVAGAVALFGLANAQRVQQGETQLNAGVGFANAYGLPVYAGVDYGVHPDITVGAEASFATKNYSYANYSDFKGKWFAIGVNGNYHFNTLLKIPNKFDVYAGVTLAYNSFTYDYPNNWNGYGWDSKASGVGFGGQVGGRYYFTDKFGVNVEFGGGTVLSGGKAGISYKF